MKTYSPRPQDIERRWYVVDADGAVLGRLASEVAKILRGKHKPIFAPHADTGDHVIVINARGVRLTGDKAEKKMAYRHSGYPGGLTETSYARLMADRPRFVVEKAVKGMLPKNRLGRAMVKKLQVYEGAEHPHAAQQPVALALGEVPAWTGLPAPKPKPVRATKEERKRPAARKASTAPASKRSGAKKATATRKTTTRKAATAAPRKSPVKRLTAKRSGSGSTTKEAATATPATSSAKAKSTAKSTAGESKPRRRSRKSEEES
jgi:large subunit ribosomal protein L13